MKQNNTLNITAHSGCENTEPNSLDFIRTAIESGADGLEVDIRRVNQQLVLSHNEPNRAVPALGELFKLIKDTKLYVNCDLKHGGLVNEVVSLAKEYGIHTGRLMFTGSVELEDAKRDDDAQIFINLEGMPFTGLEDSPVNYESVEAVAKQCSAAKVCGLNMEFHVVDEKVMEICNAYNLLVTVWTVDDTEELKKMYSHHVYSITTNCPKTAIQIKQEFARI